MTDTKAVLAASAEQLKLFVAYFTAVPGPVVVELRAPRVPQRYGGPKTESGYFDLSADPKPLWEAVKAYLVRPPAEQPDGVYVTINPVNPALLARAHNRVRVADKGGTTADPDVVARRWVVVDADPKRPAGISATDAEKAAARLLADGVREDLAGRGWPAPVVVDSGNGFHLWYRYDAPADDGGEVERLLKALAAKHDTPEAKVDPSLFNPSRIIKLPGTWARKGDAIPDRPHRLARVLEVPPA